METQEHEGSYASLIHNKPLADAYTANIISLGVAIDDCEEKGERPSGSTDMGNVSHVLPSIHPFYSVGSGVLNHTKEFTTIAGKL